MKMKPAPQSLFAHLSGHDRIKTLFGESNLFKALSEQVKNGSLYLPPNGYETSSVHFHGLAMGYRGEYYRVKMLVYIQGYNPNRDENEEISVTVEEDIPITVADSYSITTESYGHPSNHLTREVMTFDYSKKGFALRVKERRDTIRARLKESLIKKRDELNGEIKRLG